MACDCHVTAGPNPKPLYDVRIIIRHTNIIITDTKRVFVVPLTPPTTPHMCASDDGDDDVLKLTTAFHLVIKIKSLGRDRWGGRG